MDRGDVNRKLEEEGKHKNITFSYSSNLVS